MSHIIPTLHETQVELVILSKNGSVYRKSVHDIKYR